MKILILCLSALIALSGCEGGGSDKKTTNPDPGTTVESFSLGGAVSGLSGNLAIANGDETITLNQDGAFVFAKKVTKGQLYDIKIVALPQSQLCEIRNSRNYIYRNRGDVSIECANLVKRKVDIQIPANHSLSSLRLMSNFEALGGSGEGVLQESNEMTVFENSFLSLRNSDNKILYLSFIDSVEASSFNVNSMTTAKALVLLEPAVISAIQDRNITIAQVQHNLFINVDTNGSLSKLSQQIQDHIEQGGSLLDVQSQLDQDLHDSVIAALSALSKLPLSTPSNATASIQKKNTVISPVDDSGIKLTMEKVSSSGQALNLIANNNFHRHATLHSSAFNNQIIGPDESITISLPTGLSSQATLPVVISGPGSKGNFSTEHRSKLISSTKSTSAYEFFTPSINILLGLKNPAQFTVKDCVENETFDLLINSIIVDDADNLLLDSKYWHRLMSSMASDVRTQFIDVPLASRLTPLETVFSCEKFGIGVLISSKKKYAIENTHDILKVVNSTHSNAYRAKSVDFFSIKTANKLSQTINNAYLEQIFTLANQLQLTISRDPLDIVEGRNIKFTGSCINPVDQTNVACDMTWTFPSNTVKTGLSVDHVFATDGNYSVNVKAKDIDGAEASQTLNIEVLDIAPRIEITNPNGISMQQNDLYPFNGVVIGETVPAIFSIKNSGFSDLTISGVSSTNNRFSISASFPQVIKPNESNSFTLAFTPTQKSNELADINIQSNDAKNPGFTIKASGTGLESLASWVVIKNGVEQQYAASRISTSYDQSLKRLQIRAFNSENSDYPQIRILLNNYDLNSNGRGNGEYSLDDIDQNETCLGFFATEEDDTKIFCTQTLNLMDAEKKTGTAIVTSGLNPDNKRTTFSFDAIQRNCPSQTCETIEVSGDILYRDSF